MHDEQSWLRGGSGGGGLHGWSSQAPKDGRALLEPDPFADFGDWGSGGGAEAAAMIPALSSSSSSWQSSMHEHDSTFPSAYPLFSDSVSSLSSPSNQLGSASFSFTASAPQPAAFSYPPSLPISNSSLPATVAKTASTSASEGQWLSRTTTPASAELTSPRLSLASTVVSSSASSALSSTPSSVSSSSPVSPLVLSNRDAARKPDAIRVPPFDAPSSSSHPRPTFIAPASLPSSLLGAPHVFSSSSTALPSSTAESSKYQSRDMTSGTPIFSSSSMSPPTTQPRQLQRPSHSPNLPTAAGASSPLPPVEHTPSPTIAFRSMSIATGSPIVVNDSLALPQSQSYSGKERKQTSIRATRKMAESSPMTGVQRLVPGGHSPTMATASVMAHPALPSAGQTPPGSRRKGSRKLGVMIDVPVKPNLTTAAALSGGMPGLTPPKGKRSMNKAGTFSPHSFTSSPHSPDRPFPAPVVATISPLTEQRTMRATGVTVASPVEANSRLAPYLANAPTSPPVASAVGPPAYSNYLSSQQHHSTLAAATRATASYEDDNRNSAPHQQHQPHQQPQSFHTKQRDIEEYKSNDEAQLMRGPARFMPNEPQRFTPSDELSLPSTPYSPGPSTHDTHGRLNSHPAAAHSHNPQLPWARQYSAPAAAPSFSHPSNDSARQVGRLPERGNLTGPQQQQQSAMLRSISSGERSYQATDSGATASWAEPLYASRTRDSLPSTPLDHSPYADSSPASQGSFPSQRPTYVDETASSALLSTLAAKFSAMQRATSAPSQPPMPHQHGYGGRQRSDSINAATTIDEQRTTAGPHPLFNSGNASAALLAQRQQQLLEHFKQTNPTLQALSPEATAFLAALMSAEQTQHVAHNSQSMQAAAGKRTPPLSSTSRPPSSPTVANHSSFPPSHNQPSHGSMPPFTEKQLQQLQQHLSIQQRHLQQKLAQQLQHQGGRHTSSFATSGQQQYNARHSPPTVSSSHQSDRPASTGPLTPCPMSSAGCELQFRSANEMQAHFLACHM